MKRSHSLDFVVGLFVLAGMFAFLLLALKVSGLQDFSLWIGRNDGLILKANFTNIGGLKPRSRVTIGGVNVGRIKNIVLDPSSDNYDAVVEMSINPEFVNKIPEDSSAGIRTAGLIGDNYIAITPGVSETYLKSGDTMTETHSALVLEDLISKFLYSKTNGSESESESESGSESGAGSEKLSEDTNKLNKLKKKARE